MPPRELLVELRLQRVVRVVRAVAEIVDALGPAERPAEAEIVGDAAGEERLPVVLRHVRVADERGLIDVDGRAVAGEDVPAAGCRRSRPRDDMVLGQLPLHHHVERVHRRRPLLLRKGAREHAVRQRELAVLRDRGEDGRRRSLREREHAVEVLRRVELLHRQHRQVLRHAVAEERSEHAEVVAAAVAAADDGLAGRADRSTPTRGAQLRRFSTSPFNPMPPTPATRICPVVEIQEAAVAGLVHRLRVDDVEPQAVVERQLARSGARCPARSRPWRHCCSRASVFGLT
mgnify:CR=1 FL=1